MSSTHYLKVFQDEAGEYRWHEMKSSDIISESGEGYANRQDAIDQAKAHAPSGVEVLIEGTPMAGKTELMPLAPFDEGKPDA